MSPAQRLADSRARLLQARWGAGPTTGRAGSAGAATEGAEAWETLVAAWAAKAGPPSAAHLAHGLPWATARAAAHAALQPWAHRHPLGLLAAAAALGAAGMLLRPWRWVSAAGTDRATWAHQAPCAAAGGRPPAAVAWVLPALRAWCQARAVWRAWRG